MTEKTCIFCGKKFTPTKNAQRICSDKHYRKCRFCGKEFEITRPTDSKQCCSKECTKKLREQTMVERYGVAHALQNPDLMEKAESTSLERFGVKHAAQSDAIKEQVKSQFQTKYGVDWPTQMSDFAEKSKKTCLERYGVEFTSQIPGRTDKMQATNLERYGAVAPILNPDIRRDAYRDRCHKSALEIRLREFLKQYNIKYEEEYSLKSDVFSHSFDFFLPDYKLLIDCDGIYYHGYLDDPDGRHVIEEYDHLRLTCIPADYRFCVIVENDFERGLRNLQKMLQNIDSGLFDYDSEIFQWCRSIGFPYYDYTDRRLLKEWRQLQAVDVDTVSMRNNFGISIINQFHPSIFDCHVDGRPSPREAWYDDELLKKVIANRLIYQNDVNPSKVLQGFNISKTAPKVSVFRPILAKKLTVKYLSDCDVIADPFSGFSGRLLGVVAAGKRYVGHDIRDISISESNNIIQYLNLEDVASVTHQDLFETELSEFDALLTCPPYGSKESYINNQKNLSCDQWIQECMKRYKCRKYVFVVDQTELFKDNVVDTIQEDSHFRKKPEFVLMFS